jgi:hypothetical protein
MVAALGGGIMRDVLLGRTPPATLNDLRYLIPAFDAAGLGLFTVTGTIAALGAGLSFVASALRGMLTGIGGGALRDVLAGEVPFDVGTVAEGVRLNAELLEVWRENSRRGVDVDCGCTFGCTFAPEQARTSRMEPSTAIANRLKMWGPACELWPHNP